MGALNLRQQQQYLHWGLCLKPKMPSYLNRIDLLRHPFHGAVFLPLFKRLSTYLHRPLANTNPIFYWLRVGCEGSFDAV